MKIQDNHAPRSDFWTGAIILALGVAIGALVGTMGSGGGAVNVGSEVDESDSFPIAAKAALQIPVAPADVPEVPPVNDLKTIEIVLEQAASDTLQAVYDRSMLLGRIAQEEGDLVPAIIKSDGKEIEAMLRIKGDFLDHLDTDKWSFRVELESEDPSLR